MPLNNPKPGYSYAGEFQSSALPWVTSSTVSTVATKFEFHHVSRFISALNLEASGSGKNLYMGFTQNGVNGSNYIVLQPQNPYQPIELRVKEVWLKSSTGTVSFSLLAGLTAVENALPLTGTLQDGTAGWGGVG